MTVTMAEIDSLPRDAAVKAMEEVSFGAAAPDRSCKHC